jgi:hypothetical protein
MSRITVLPLVLAAALVSAPTLFAQAAPVGTAQAAPSKTSGPLKPGDRNCLRSTGSLIPPAKGACLPVAGRSYGRDDIQRTGATTMGGALRLLDPSVQVRGH